VTVRHHQRLAYLLAVALTLLVPRGVSADPQWTLPEPGDCGAARPVNGSADPAGSGVPFGAGDVFGFDRLSALEPYLPREVWQRRDHFFFEGMRLEVGPCFRSYAPPGFFREATQTFAGRARALESGGLEGVPAGLPFEPASIDAGDPQAGQKWAWNVARRYRGAGSFGDLRLTYAQRGEATVQLVGSYFVAFLTNRADLAAADYRVPWAGKQRWASGGRTRDPSSGAYCAFRHYRDPRVERTPDLIDDLFFYSTGSRKPERVGWNPEFPMLVCAYERGFYLARGGRIERYRWRVATVRDLLAPINARTPAYPEAENRSFGAFGASLASDRWELRRVLVLEAPLGPGQSVRRYVDLETLFPLYHVEGADGGPVIFQYAGRWSEDRPDYPRWPETPERALRIIDPVARVYVGGSEVVRIEAWNTVAVPPEGKSLRRMVSESSLARRR